MVRIPLRLSTLAQVVAANVAAVFAPIVAAINGGLTADSYARHVRLPAAFKALPRAIVPVQIRLRFQNGASTSRVYAGVPAATMFGGAVALEAFRWTLRASSGAMTGTVKLYRNGVQIGTTVNVAGALPTTDEALASVAPADDSSFMLEVIGTAAGDAYDLVATVWCKARHVR